jgi:hypothetical protein
MKKIAFSLIAISLLLTIQPLQSKAATKPVVATEFPMKPTESEEAEVLLSRLNEIKAMDKANMNPSEKKSLRMEVSSIKEKLNANGGGVYLSVGAIILIIFLIIILL